MKATLLSIFWLIACVVLVSAQENTTKTIDGLLKSSKISYDHSDFDLSEDQAVKAFTLAKTDTDQLRMAKALQRQAYALLGKPKKAKANRKKAKEALESSLTLLTDDFYKVTRIISLNLLIEIAKLEEDADAAVNYQQQIDQINKLVAEAKSKKKLKAQSNKLAAETEKLEEKAAILSQEKSQLTQKVDVLADQKIILDSKIRKLNQRQLKSQLLIALQKNRADSLTFQSDLDALALAQSEMQLAEQQSKMQLQKTELQLKENELEIQKSKRNMYFALLGILGIGAGALLLRFLSMKSHNKELQVKNEIIEAEREKSEKLLLNILPSVVADELKMNGVAKARRYETATVLFTDFVNFSGISRNLSAEKIVTMLDEYFKVFDDVITSHQLEKIKTIGDAYMCVGGLPDANIGSPIDVVNAALEIQAFLELRKEQAIEDNEPYFEARIGVHSGPLVAGVVGSKKFAFDIWGDTVNIASRIETGGMTGKVNVSAATYKLIKDQFKCESRGMLPIKNIGEIEMYFVKGVA